MSSATSGWPSSGMKAEGSEVGRDLEWIVRKPESKTSKLVGTRGEKAEVLNNLFPESSLATSLPTPLEWMDHKTGIGEAKSLPL